MAETKTKNKTKSTTTATSIAATAIATASAAVAATTTTPPLTVTSTSATTTIASSTTATKDTFYVPSNATELSAIIMKGSPNSNDRDAGFCSGSSEVGDDCSIDHLRLEPSSPTDASEDSVEVKVMPISLVRNKRKSLEPSKVVCEREQSLRAQLHGPLKKRIRYTSNSDPAVTSIVPTMVQHPASNLLWEASQVLPHELIPNPAQVFVRHPGVTTLHRLAPSDVAICPEQEEPLALVLPKPTKASESNDTDTPHIHNKSSKTNSKHFTPKKRFVASAAIPETSIKQKPPHEPLDKLVTPPRPKTALSTTTVMGEISKKDLAFMDSNSPTSSTNGSNCNSKSQQRNYKNMTRERRIEANARERSRVHTISAAYETLRRAIPSYSSNQKLSKLSVLRVACSYILTLSRMAGHDYSADQSAPSISSCFDAITATIQTEGKIRKKKDD